MSYLVQSIFLLFLQRIHICPQLMNYLLFVGELKKKQTDIHKISLQFDYLHPNTSQNIFLLTITSLFPLLELVHFIFTSLIQVMFTDGGNWSTVLELL